MPTASSPVVWHWLHNLNNQLFGHITNKYLASGGVSNNMIHEGGH